MWFYYQIEDKRLSALILFGNIFREVVARELKKNLLFLKTDIFTSTCASAWILSSPQATNNTIPIWKR